MTMEHVELYDPNKTFANCSCPECEKISYSIEHNKKPLELSKMLVEAIEMLLWYSPNNKNSSQSFRNEYLSDITFDNAVMTYFTRYMGMKSEDIRFIEEPSIPQNLLSPYMNKACVPCQKIIVARKNSKKEQESKMDCIIRHLRNCLAHGRFNFLFGDNIIGFDTLPVKGSDEIIYTAIFKTDIKKLYKFCTQLIRFPDFTVSHIFQYLYSKQGHHTAPFMWHITREGIREDEEIVYVNIDNIAYRINCSRYIDRDPIEEYEEFEEDHSDIDEYFNSQTEYINVFYTETYIGNRRKLNESTYFLDKEALIRLYKNL